MIQPLLEAAPDFEATWREFESEWRGEAEGPPVYLLLGELARYISQQLELGNENELVRIFAVVEHWHTQGDKYVREAASVGLLEDLQNTNVVAESTPASCLKYLGPESLRWWRKVEAFWEKGELLSDT